MKLGYRPDIDGLRAIAVLAVVLFHAEPAFLKGGFAGVDIFFVISGYLISGIIFRSLIAGDFSFVEFYNRRIRRIFPALIVVLLTAWIAGWCMLMSDEFRHLGKHIFAASLFLSNFLLWREAGYFDVSSDLKPLLHLWSLGVEEQFYLLWPFLAVIFWRLRVSFRIPIFLLLGFSLSANLLWAGRDGVSSFYLPHTRFWELMVGSYLAYIEVMRDVGKREVGSKFTPSPLLGTKTSNLRSFIGLILITISFVSFDKSVVYPGWRAILPTVGALLVISGGKDAFLNRQILSGRFLNWTGKISYPLYLWHWTLLVLVRIVNSGPLSYGATAVIVALAFLLAWATYRFIELPIRSSRNIPYSSKSLAYPRLGALHITPMLIVLLLSLGGGGFLTWENHGFPERLRSYEKINKSFQREDLSKITEECRKQYTFPTGYCSTRKGARPSVALIGDSHSNALWWGIDELYAQKGEATIQLGNGGCLPFFDVERYSEGKPVGCPKIINAALEFAISSPEIKTVILAGRYTVSVEGTGFGEMDAALSRRYFEIRDTKNPEVTDPKDVFGNAMARTIKKLHAAGKSIIFMQQVPELDFDPKSCVRLRPGIFWEESRTPCAVSRKKVEERQRGYRKIVAMLLANHPYVQTVNPTEGLCDNAWCYAKVGGEVLYRDNHHLNLTGSLFLSKRLARRIMN